MNTFLMISNILLWVVVIVQLVLFFVLARLVVNFMKRFQLTGRGVEQMSLKVGQKAPLFREFDQNGELIQMNQYGGRHTLVLFSNNTCAICKDIVPKLPLLGQSYNLRLINIQREQPERPVPAGVHLLLSDEIVDNYFANQVPLYVLVDENGFVVGTDQVENFQQLNLLLQSLLLKAA